MNKIAMNLNGANKRVGVVLSRFNSNIGEGLLEACSAKLIELGVKTEDIQVATVPGALEIPVVLQHMALSDEYDALIALGAIVRGETYHFEVVANESARGVSEVQLNTGIPIANAILTTESNPQAQERMHQKGAEAAECAIEIANLVTTL